MFSLETKMTRTPKPLAGKGYSIETRRTVSWDKLGPDQTLPTESGQNPKPNGT